MKRGSGRKGETIKHSSALSKILPRFFILIFAGDSQKIGQKPLPNDLVKVFCSLSQKRIRIKRLTAVIVKCPAIVLYPKPSQDSH
jgi:hypothetical protein